MNSLDFSIYLCGMCDEYFSNQIMIYKPYLSIKWSLDIETLEQENISTVSQLIEYVKASNIAKAALGEYGLENFSFRTTYIKYDDYLLGIKNDREISDVFSYFDTHHLEFAHFQVSGASINGEYGYSYHVKSNEGKHRYMPHVHVKKAGVDIRYHLETLKHIDEQRDPHLHEYEKKIKPFLEKNKNRLLKMWEQNLAGYSPPKINEDGTQYYSESQLMNYKNARRTSNPARCICNPYCPKDNNKWINIGNFN